MATCHRDSHVVDLVHLESHKECPGLIDSDQVYDGYMSQGLSCG